MHLLRKLKMLCAALAVASCAPIQPRFAEVQVPPERISQKGFSLMPLNEKGWVIGARNPHLLSLGKVGKNPEENVVVRAILSKLPAFKTNEEFVRLIKENQVKGTNPQRLRIIKHEVVTYPKNGTDCAKSHMVAEDHGAGKQVGKTGVMIIEALTLACAHPKQKDTGVSVSYSQRYYPGKSDPGFLEKATSVLNSVEFADL